VVAVPLRNGGYALGIITRGSYKTRGGLGYFFGPKYQNVPTDADTQSKQATDAILIAWFGDLGIIEGEWPLITSTRPFRREEWPVPKFGRIDALMPEKGWLVEYDPVKVGFGQVIRETRCRAEDVANLPKDGLYGAGAIEITLTKLLAGS
jgi:hypothetical protein